MQSEKVFYVVTAREPSRVTKSAAGAFMDELNLVICKNDKIDIHKVVEEGLESVVQIPMNGKIADLKFLRPHGFENDVLVVLTEENHWVILEYLKNKKDVRVLHFGKLNGEDHTRSEQGSKITTCPHNRLIGFQVFKGKMSFLPTEFRTKGNENTIITRNVRDIPIDTYDIIDQIFLESKTPGSGLEHDTIVVLSKTMEKKLVTNVYSLDITSKKSTKIHRDSFIGEGDPHTLLSVPPPYSGWVEVGEEKIIYRNMNFEKVICELEFRKKFYTSERIDELRFVLGDDGGILYLLVLVPNQEDTNKIQSIHFSVLGKISFPPDTITYIDKSVVFIGSLCGDSLLVRIHSNQNIETKSHLEIIGQGISSIGPINDFVLIPQVKLYGRQKQPPTTSILEELPPPTREDRMNDEDDDVSASPATSSGGTNDNDDDADEVLGKEQCTVVTLSGYGKNGSIRVVRSGVGVEEMASLENMVGIRSVFTLFQYVEEDDDDVVEDEDEEEEEDDDDEVDGENQKMGTRRIQEDECVVLSFINQTVLLGFSEDGTFGPVKKGGFDLGSRTLLATTTSQGYYLQITSKQIRLIHPNDEDVENALVDQWIPHDMEEITNADFREDYVLVTVGKNLLFLLRIEVDGEENKVKISQRLDRELKDLEITCAKLPISTSSRNHSQWVLVGCWDRTVRILSPQTFEEVLPALKVDDLPRHVLLTCLENREYLFVSLGNGVLMSYQISDDPNNKLVPQKKISLGDESGRIKELEIGNEECILIASDRPTVITSRHEQLSFSFLNTSGVTDICKYKIDNDDEDDDDESTENETFVLVFSDRLIIGKIGELHRLHVQKTQLNCHPLKITEIESSGYIAVTTVKTDAINQMETGALEIRENKVPFRLISSHVLGPNLHGSSILFHNELKLLVVGGTYVYPQEVEPTKGELFIFQEVEVAVSSSDGSTTTDENASGRNNAGRRSRREWKLLVSEKVNGGVLSVCRFKERKLLVSVNAEIRVYEIGVVEEEEEEDEEDEGEDEDEDEDGDVNVQQRRKKKKKKKSSLPVKFHEKNISLKMECMHPGNIFTLTLHSKGDFVFVGDVMKSVSLLRYEKMKNQSNGRLVQICHDFKPRNLMCSEIVDEETIIISDFSGNLMILKRPEIGNIEKGGNGMVDEDQSSSLNMYSQMLEVVGSYHLGDIVNCIKRGNIVMRDSSHIGIVKMDTFVYGTINGAIGIIAQLPTDPKYGQFMCDFESILSRNVESISSVNRSHESYRTVRDRRNMALTANESSTDVMGGGGGGIGRRRFVDGDLVELFPRFSEVRKLKILEDLKAAKPMTYEDLTVWKIEKRIEDISRNIH